MQSIHCGRLKSPTGSPRARVRWGCPNNFRGARAGPSVSSKREPSASGTGRRVWRALAAWSSRGSNALTTGRWFDKAAWGSRSMNQEPALVRHVLVEGRVQGVGYREFTRRRALRLGISGWVRNRSDSAVEAVCPRRRRGRRSASRRDAHRAARGRGHEFAHRRTQRGRGRGDGRIRGARNGVAAALCPSRRIRRRPIH